MSVAALGAAGCATTSDLVPHVDFSDLREWVPERPAIVDRVVSASTQSVLRTTLTARNNATSPGLADLVAFYRARNFQPAWTGGLSEQAMARDARSQLARAHEQGLNDEEYAAPSGGAVPSGDRAAAYDIAFTDAVLRYARDVRTGRVRPKDVFEDVGLPAPDFDTGLELARAVRNHALPRFFASLPPPHPEYRRLAAAYARYREMADEGGWPTIAGQNEVRLDGKDTRLDAVVKRLKFEDETLSTIPKPSMGELREAVKRFQTRNGLEADGRVGGGTIAALNVSASERASQIAANMERWRWLPGRFESRYVAVNVPDQSVAFVRNGEVVLRSKVVVGRKANPTPITRSEIKAVVVNPPWNIPGFIAARDLLPRLKQNANYLASRNMVVMDGPDGDPHGRTIDWKSVKPADFPYAIRQLPGPATALGAVMLDSPNDFDVYLHDTPNKNLFKLDDREISNGCIRVQQVFPLASLALTGDAEEGMNMLNAALKTHQTQRIELDRPVPVYFLYWTVLPGEDGQIEFRPDRYGRDKVLIAAMTNRDRTPANKAKTAARNSDSSSENEDLAP